MGTNSSVMNREAETNSKSTKRLTKRLESELKQFETGYAKLSDEYLKVAGPFYSEHIAYLKMKIAERIGRK